MLEFRIPVVSSLRAHRAAQLAWRDRRRRDRVMSDLAGAADVERFRAAVARRLGLQFDDGKLSFLGEVLQRRLGRRCAYDYLSGLEEAPSSDEIGALARELTVGETYFFRNNEQFRALAEVALPERMRDDRRPGSCGSCRPDALRARKPIRSRSSREKPYRTLRGRRSSGRWTSIPPLSKRRNSARYSTWALRETSPDLQQMVSRGRPRGDARREGARGGSVRAAEPRHRRPGALAAGRL